LAGLKIMISSRRDGNLSKGVGRSREARA
jgi:hypothetical protein